MFVFSKQNLLWRAGAFVFSCVDVFDVIMESTPIYSHTVFVSVQSQLKAEQCRMSFMQTICFVFKPVVCARHPRLRLTLEHWPCIPHMHKDFQ